MDGATTATSVVEVDKHRLFAAIDGTLDGADAAVFPGDLEGGVGARGVTVAPTQVSVYVDGAEAKDLVMSDGKECGARMRVMSSTLTTPEMEEQMQKAVTRGKLTRIGVGHPREESAVVFKVYLLLLALNIMVNFDSGAVPACVDVIQRELKLTKTDMGLIGSMPYWGLFLACPFLGLMLKIFSQKEILGFLLFCNAGMCIMFSYAGSFYQMAIARLFIGITQGGFVIYSPCWVDDMAPVESKTLWIGLLQAVVPIGIVVGYMVAGQMSANGIHWSYSLVLQAMLVTFLTCIFVLIPYRYIDDFWISPRLYETRERLKRSQGMKSQRNKSVTANMAARFTSITGKKTAKTSVIPDSCTKEITDLDRMKALVKNPIFVSVTCTLSTLWFVVTGVQYWATDFFVSEYQVEKSLVVSCFSIVALTGPTVGVIAGSIITDRRGGYEGPVQRQKALMQCMYCAIIATGFGLLAGDPMMIRPGEAAEGAKLQGASGAYWLEICLLWGVLAFGGAIVPTATGVMVSSVPSDCKSLASGAGQGFYNLFGYAMGTLIPSTLMEPLGMMWGMRVLFGWSILGVVGLFCALIAVGAFGFKGGGVSANKNIEFDPNDHGDSGPPPPSKH